MKTCNECGAHDAPSIPYIAYESAKARDERNFRRLWVVILVLIGLLFGTNAAWLWYESRYASEDIDITAKQDGSGTNIVNAGGYIYGADGTNRKAQ